MGNSFFGKLSTYDPLNHLTGGRFGQIAGDVAMTVDPAGGYALKKLGGTNSYSTSSGPGTPGPYANVAPTLADANAGYVRAAAGAQQPNNNSTSLNNIFGNPNPVPRPVGVQPVVPGATAQRLAPGNLYGY